MESIVYNQKGEKKGNVALPEEIFNLPWNADLVHQVVMTQRGNLRTPVAHTKTRGEVSGGGKKPWKQKGTGRARHGSTRSPIWVGGGVAHGPRNDKKYGGKVNKKMKAKALYTVLSQKNKDGEMLFVDSISFDAPKTKDALAVIKALSTVKGFEKLSTKKNNAVCIALSEKDENVKKSFKNFGNVSIAEVRNLTPDDLLTYKYILIVNPEESLKIVSSKLK